MAGCLGLWKGSEWCFCILEVQAVFYLNEAEDTFLAASGIEDDLGVVPLTE